MRRRSIWIAAALAVAALALLMTRGRGGGADRARHVATGEAADSPAARAPVGGAALHVVPDPAAEELPGVHCWQGLLAVDRAGTLADLRAVLGRAVASGDELLAAYAGDRLAELVGADPARAHELLDLAAAAPGREAELLFDALSRTAAVQHPGVRDRLLAAAEDRGADVAVRAAAVGALETQTRLEGEALGRVAALALDAEAGGAAWTATRTLGRVMKEDFARTGHFERYWDQLLDISARTGDPEVRVLALEMPAYVDPVLGGRHIDELAALLRTAPERQVRELAAFQLGLTGDPARVLDVFRAAFPREPELCVRWAILRFAVRAGGSRALPALDEMARADARFAADVADFRRIYASGLEDFERVWLDKAEHHACSADEDAHGREGSS